MPLRKLHAKARPSQNADYDIQTLLVMQRVLRPSSNCIDVGCHLGQFLASILRLAPQGRHFAFEPLPEMCQALRSRHRNRPNVAFYDCALSDEAGTASFQHVLSNPAYSGLRRRRYDRPDEQVVQVQVPVSRLDDVLAPEIRIDFIKIDVEGAELQVLRGAVRTLVRWRPLIVFEHGLGAADHYGTTPDAVFSLLVGECGLMMFLMADWLRYPRGRPLDRVEFRAHFDTARNYYFMAVQAASTVR